MTHTTFLAGGIASGKSTVARLLHDRGAWLCDLDQVSREVLEAGSPVLDAIAAVFGDDLIDGGTGELNRGELAARAFATPEDTARLEAIEMPAIRERLAAILTSSRHACDRKRWRRRGVRVCRQRVVARGYRGVAKPASAWFVRV